MRNRGVILESDPGPVPSNPQLGLYCFELPRDLSLLLKPEFRSGASVLLVNRRPHGLPLTHALSCQVTTWSSIGEVPRLLRSSARGWWAERALDRLRVSSSSVVVSAAVRRLLTAVAGGELSIDRSASMLASAVGCSVRTLGRHMKSCSIDLPRLLALSRLAVAASWKEDHDGSWTAAAHAIGYAGIAGLSELSRRELGHGLRSLPFDGSINLARRLSSVVEKCPFG